MENRPIGDKGMEEDRIGRDMHGIYSCQASLEVEALREYGSKDEVMAQIRTIQREKHELLKKLRTLEEQEAVLFKVFRELNEIAMTKQEEWCPKFIKLETKARTLIRGNEVSEVSDVYEVRRGSVDCAKSKLKPPTLDSFLRINKQSNRDQETSKNLLTTGEEPLLRTLNEGRFSTHRSRDKVSINMGKQTHRTGTDHNRSRKFKLPGLQQNSSLRKSFDENIFTHYHQLDQQKNKEKARDELYRRLTGRCREISVKRAHPSSVDIVEAINTSQNISTKDEPAKSKPIKKRLFNYFEDVVIERLKNKVELLSSPYLD
jgi:hypothetical protein